MFFDKFFSSPSHCVDYQCDEDAAAGMQMSPGAADAAESLSDYIRLIHTRPSVPPAPAGNRPEQRLRTYHPIPQQSAGAVVVVQGLPCGLRDVGYAVYMAGRGGVTAADVDEARSITARRPHPYPQTASIPAGYQLPAAARAVYGDDIAGAISGAAAVYYAAHDYTSYLLDRRARVDKYGAISLLAPGVVINGGTPDNTAKGAVPLTDGEENLLKKWLKIRNSESWLEDSETFHRRQEAFDEAARAYAAGENALKKWKNDVRQHPMRAVFAFEV